MYIYTYVIVYLQTVFVNMCLMKQCLIFNTSKFQLSVSWQFFAD